MKITRSIQKDGNFAPAAVNYLINIPEAFLFHERHGLRHPFSIYHVSLRAVTDGFARVLEEHSNEVKLYRTQGDLKFFKKLLRAQQNLLYSLREHIDDCYSVFKTLVDPARVNKKIVFTDKYLHTAKFKEVDKFDKSIQSYKQHYLSPLVNSLKHSHARLQGFYCHNQSQIRLGYYLEEMRKDMVVGPSVRVHKDGNSAFSFSRDLILNLFNVYYISEQLITSVQRFLKATYDFELVQSKQNGYEEIKQAIEHAARMPQEFFSDELLKPCATIFIESDSNESRCVLSYPTTPVERSFPLGLRMACFMYPDSKSKKFKLPYVGPRIT
jgi:hypothetical protein